MKTIDDEILETFGCVTVHGTMYLDEDIESVDHHQSLVYGVDWFYSDGEQNVKESDEDFNIAVTMKSGAHFGFHGKTGLNDFLAFVHKRV